MCYQSHPSSIIEGCFEMKIALLTIHGLVRAENVELGRDPDTGGQIVYVLELAKALAQLPSVEWVQVWTKSIKDYRISPEYCQKEEPLLKNIPLEKACIVRIPCMGSEDYIPKELMWDQLDLMVDAIVRYATQENKVPDVVHSHYADAGYVAIKVCSVLQCIHTHVGHSLGRTKLSVLQSSGMKMEDIESQYQITRRIESEECCLDYASLIVTSTADEIDSQWSLYDQKRRSIYVVIPPGIDLTRFHPPAEGDMSSACESPYINLHASRFLTNTDKKVILMICRPDKKKNIENLIRIYGCSEYLKAKANLVLILGNRSDLDIMDIHSQEILLNVFKLIDLYDLYGNVMYPKQHEQHDIPEIYRYAASRKGVFVNISWFEPFGLTLLESAASGLPAIATCRGGAAEIIQILGHGIAVDPSSNSEIERAIQTILDEPKTWENFVQNGLKNLYRFSWDCHANHLFNCLLSLYNQRTVQPLVCSKTCSDKKILICDLDNVLLGDYASMSKLLSILDNIPSNFIDKVELWICTGRSIESSVQVLLLWGVYILPKIIISSVGTEIYYLKVEDCHIPSEKQSRVSNISFVWNGPKLRVEWQGEDVTSQTCKLDGNRMEQSTFVTAPMEPYHTCYYLTYEKDMEYFQFLSCRKDWDRQKIVSVVNNEWNSFMRLQSSENQRDFKISYDLISNVQYEQNLCHVLQQRLRRSELCTSVWISLERHIDIVPAGVSKAVAIRRAATLQGVLLENILASVSVGADADLIRGNIRLVAPANHDSCVEHCLKESPPPPQLYFAKSSFAQGFLEGICHFRIFESFGGVIATDEGNLSCLVFPPSISSSTRIKP
ncbi:hypothetical protein GpartN1_g1086.t1 [Galdieria partita]|uniref:sucrose-phosphate synthase n=1 Tax=Galdieria partita TaxID=83374 RepID=A0A9C7UNA4_9RHOD|nr:hypothetical protein GpartN1_g1086.t1 [Galdieria partita]